MRESVVSCPHETCISVSFMAIVSLLCMCQASELFDLNFGSLITNHSHSHLFLYSYKNEFLCSLEGVFSIR